MLLAGTSQILFFFLLQISMWEVHCDVFTKSEKKFAALQWAAHILFCFLLFPSEEHTLLKQVSLYFFFFLFRGGCRRQDGNGIKTHFPQELM